MFELLTHEAIDEYLTDDEWTVNEVLVQIPNFRSPKYSSALTDLIKQCLMPNVLNRPSSNELKLIIRAKCQSISDEYIANPSLKAQDRLYYRGSEINQMPSGDWDHRYPGKDYVPRPSEASNPNDPKNPFTSVIVYPSFSTTELRSLRHEEDAQGKEYEDANEIEGNEEILVGSRGDGGQEVQEVILILDDPSRGTGGRRSNPFVISDSDEEHEVNERSVRSEVNEGDGVDDGEIGNRLNGDGESIGSNRSEDEKSPEGSSDDSNDSEVKRRMAIKKLPGP